MPTPRFLLEGPPGIGKTTVVRRVVELLREAHAPLGGFTTRELREHGRRVGFMVEAIDGPSAVMAHVAFRAGPRVGRYRVDVPAFERVALPAMTAAREQRRIAIIDELGRMELASAAFVAELHELVGGDLPMLATVHVHAHPVTDALKTRPDLERVRVTLANRDELPGDLTARLVR